METILIAKEGEYWSYKNNCGSHGIEFHFNKDGSYDKYNNFIDRGFVLFNNDGDLISDPKERTWSIVNDSVLRWKTSDYKIVTFTDKKIVLSYIDEQNILCNVILTKVFDKRLKNGQVKK
ncbi:MAG: hypothetical protein ABI576_21175 [Flavobacterium sp.]